ncbi:MAG: hypothetical protein KDC95_06335 [Planctomycetes bacterium]|nr:hypothetical protein [Planctomycetota bacterium]
MTLLLSGCQVHTSRNVVRVSVDEVALVIGAPDAPIRFDGQSYRVVDHLGELEVVSARLSEGLLLEPGVAIQAELSERSKRQLDAIVEDDPGMLLRFALPNGTTLGVFGIAMPIPFLVFGPSEQTGQDLAEFLRTWFGSVAQE